MKTYKIEVLEGDGIGPEVMEQSIKVLDPAGISPAGPRRTVLETLASYGSHVPATWTDTSFPVCK